MRRSDSDKGSSGHGRRGKIPVPVSVSLFNLFPISWEKQLVQNTNKKFFRPAHAMSLLHQVRLEIVIAPKGKGDISDSKLEDNTSREEKVIFSSLAPAMSVNPSWNHLDECIEDYLALDGYLDAETGFYRFMRLRIWLVPEEKEDSADMSAADESDQSNNDDTYNQPLLDISIHPTKLQRLAKVPQQLPINSLIFHFSDGSIRATATLLDLVGDQDGSHADEHLKDEFGRFGDDVFRTLDSVTPVKKEILTSKGDSNNDGMDSSLGQTNIEDLATTVSEDSNDAAVRSAAQTHNKAAQECMFHKDLLSGTENARFEDKEAEVVTKDVSSERQHLERLVQLEEEALSNELQHLEEEKSQLRLAITEAGKINDNLHKLEQGLDSELQLCRQTEFFLEARRMKLLRDLQNIYPISFVQGEDRFCIRDLRIPSLSDIHSGTVGEDELSSALGYLCHVVSLVSKYLSVQLRYRVFCNSSRSAIQEDGGAIFPLFQARAVERDQLDHGVRLLHRNVACILKTRDIEQRTGEHILVAVKRIFDQVY